MQLSCCYGAAIARKPHASQMHASTADDDHTLQRDGFILSRCATSGAAVHCTAEALGNDVAKLQQQAAKLPRPALIADIVLMCAYGCTGISSFLHPVPLRGFVA